MSWVRGPWWDGFWLLSGLPIGLLLLVLYAYGIIPPLNVVQGQVSRTIGPLAATITILETAHRASPIILSWANPGLRDIVRTEWVKYLVLPIPIMAGCFLVPWPVALGLYFTWNIWHFGMQIFGVTCLYRPPRSTDERFYRALCCVAFTAFCIGIWPFTGTRGPALGMLSFGVFSFNHWLVDIGLSSKAVGRWSYEFLLLVFGIGAVWFALRCGPLATANAPWVMPLLLGIGMVHFVYSTCPWRFSDPRVRAAIKKELFV